MAKTLNELSRELKEYIIDLQSDAHNAANMNSRRYNNLKLSMDIAKNPRAHVIISISLSEAIIDLKTGQKESGSLGPDERYVQRWIGKSGVLESLQEVWKTIEDNRGKASPTENEE